MTGGHGPGGGDRAAEWVRARNRVARRHHPDLGGDADAYLRALAEVDTRYGRGPTRPEAPRLEVHRDTRIAARIARVVARAGRLARRATRALPRRLRPGPDYIDL